MKTIRIETLGCRLNQIESESAAHYFLKYNFDVQMSPVNASLSTDENTILVIINTCTVTQKSEQKARRIIRLNLQKYPNACVLVTGCYAQLRPLEIMDIDERICVLGGQIKSRIVNIPQLLNSFLQNNNWKVKDFICILKEKIINPKQEKIGYPENSFELSGTSLVAHSRASLKIQDGCNNNCSYCAIHLARGHSVSIDVQTAINRVVELEQQGNEEVVLTTINIAQYKSLYNGESINFAKLLKLLLDNTKKICFRISSLYPEVVDDEFCEIIKDERVQPHFHISVQSGSNKILKLMNRVYTAEDVLNACNKLKKSKDNPFLACDIITGFPGESDNDFNETVDLCKKCNFTWIHAFPYSMRPGTKAIELKDKVPQSVSGKRAEILNEIAVKNKIEYISSFINKPMTAILEKVKQSQISNNKIEYHALTSNFIHCKISSNCYKEQCKKVNIKIFDILEENIKKGGELEASAIFI